MTLPISPAQILVDLLVLGAYFANSRKGSQTDNSVRGLITNILELQTELKKQHETDQRLQQQLLDKDEQIAQLKAVNAREDAELRACQISIDQTFKKA